MYRIRIGDFRVLYSVISVDDAILVFRVDKRSRAYGRLKEVKISRGSAISPASAVAAAVSGDARYMNPPVPIRPLKLRLAVERQTSPSPSTP